MRGLKNHDSNGNGNVRKERNMIGWMRTNSRAARAARISVTEVRAARAALVVWQHASFGRLRQNTIV